MLTSRWGRSTALVLLTALGACGGSEETESAQGLELARAAQDNQADLNFDMEEVPNLPEADAARKSALAVSGAPAERMPLLGTRPVSDASAARSGAWSKPFDTGLVGIHLNVLPDGELMYYGATANGAKFDYKALVFGTIKPGESSMEYPSYLGVSSFCTGNIGLSDGQVLVTGGTARFPQDKTQPTDPGFTGAKLLATFRQGETTLRPLGSGLSVARWYPTSVALNARQVVVLGGLDDAGATVAAPEVVDVVTGVSRVLSAVDLRPLGFSYPRAVQVSPNQVIVMRRWDGRPYLLDTTGAGSLTPLPKTAALPTGPIASVGNGRFLVAGSFSERLGVRSAMLAQVSASGITIDEQSEMIEPRTYHELTTLPDGSVLATGGTDGETTSKHHLGAERWVAGQGWTAMAPAALRRGYHSTAALLRDGTVIKMGSTRPVQTQAEIFYPPYLFDATGKPRTRPGVQSVSRIGSGGRADIDIVMSSDGPVSKVNLVRLGATTHQTEMGQVFVPAKFTQNGRRLTVSVPQDTSLAPAGRYWAFMLNSDGTPSMGWNVRIQ